MKLSDNFYLKEFLRNDYQMVLDPNKKQIQNIKALCDNVLEPLRRQFMVPIKINSGFRSPELNKLVNGSPNSDHMQGFAADFRTDDAFNLIKMFAHIIRALPFSQCIYYLYDKIEMRWIHVAYKPGQNKREVIICELGVKYRFEIWLKHVLGVE